MPSDDEKAARRAHELAREGKAPTTQAGEFVREEIEHVRHHKHGARSPQQAIAIGLSKARRAGVKLPPPKPGRTSARTRRQAERDEERARHPHKPAPRRSRAVKAALGREKKSSVSRKALAEHAHNVAVTRRREQRSSATKKGTVKGTAKRRSAEARKSRRTKNRSKRTSR
jgi:hypothetical protein